MMNRRKLVLVVGALAATACAEPTLVAPADKSYASLFDQMWHETDLTYSMFTIKHVNWDSVGAVYRPRAIAAQSDLAFARVLSDMLSSLHDRHVSLTPGRGAMPLTYQAASDYQPLDFDSTLVERVYLTRRLSAAVVPHFHAGWLSPTVAYIRFPNFVGSDWGGELDAALDSLQSAKQLVIDVRCNPGGNYELALDLAGRFTDQTGVFGYVRIRNGPKHDDLTDPIAEMLRPTGRRRFTGPIYLLTNRRVFSSAENFALALHQLPNVVTVGDTTGGSSGRPVTRELANGWTYELSTWIEYTADHRVVEDAGVAPALVVPRTSSVSALNKRDAVLDRVLGLAAGGG
ncbi:MAG TPA: S41 family peptidase [Gemmatimonadaceae bacterium]